MYFLRKKVAKKGLKDIFAYLRDFSACRRRFHPEEVSGVENLAWQISRRRTVLWFCFIFLGGAAYAASLPPCNLYLLAFVCQLPVYLFIRDGHRSSRICALAGWVWGLGWSLFAFRFLREIEGVVPWLLAPVISLWPAVWGALLPQLWRGIVLPEAVKAAGCDAVKGYCRRGVIYWRAVLFVFAAAGFFTLLEWSRSHLFVWNDLSVTMWRLPRMMAIAEFTGRYGVSLLITLINGAAALLLCRGRGVKLAAATVLLAVLLPVLLLWYRNDAAVEKTPTITWCPVLVQGDLSQRRNPTPGQSTEAMDVYFSLSENIAERFPGTDTVIWPESAIPLPFYSQRQLRSSPAMTAFGWQCYRYQQGVRRCAERNQLPFLIGAIDFSETLPLNGMTLQSTNSALFFDRGGRLAARYDKIHRVPYGEYVPFRKYVPSFIEKRIDMGRDIASGKSFEPISVKNGVKAGVAICYEGVFSYLTRELARYGANVLVVLSNDAWYPESSEPEQHLANAVMRSVETGLYMVRCGNNGGSCVVTPAGRVSWILEVPGEEKRLELRRGRGVGQAVLELPETPGMTFYVRYGDLIISVLWVFEVFVAGMLLHNFVRRRCAVYNRLKSGADTAGGADEKEELL